jgi:XrtN system VIT domain protein
MINRKVFRLLFSDSSLILGYVLIAFSLILFNITEKNSEFDGLGVIFSVYAVAVLYFINLWATRHLKRSRRGRNAFALYLILCLISCFTLNREIQLFNTSTTWWIVVLTICCINYAAFIVKEALPQVVRILMAFVLGISLCCFLYLVIYLLPAAPGGIIASFFLGLSLHVFVPLVFVIYTFTLVRRYIWYKPAYRYAYLSGIVAVVLLLMVYTLLWRVSANIIDKAYMADDNRDLPRWEAVARKAPQNPVTEMVLKGRLVYETADDVKGMMNGMFRSRGRRFGEEAKHDPLVMIASTTGETLLGADDAVNVLNVLYNTRQASQDRLWDGDALSTIQVRTNVRIWTSLHMAYTEKTLNVLSAKQGAGEWLNQEAIYTFHLPEGGVVTSLSLWIDDKEEKGILTTKEKADSAYQQVVGVQRRDPSLVTWQEGNTVTVRVFPVEPGKMRQVKIGVTAPLSMQGKQVVYKNIWFEGPSSSRAREDVRIDFEDEPGGMELPGMFSRKGNTLTATGAYEAGWEVAVADPGIRANQFTANGKTFFVAPYTKEFRGADIRNIYLDVNQAWTKDDLLTVRALAKGRPVWIFAANKMQVVTDELFAALQEDRFSLFPVYAVPERGTALLITKGNVTSPNLHDLAGNDFPGKIREALATPGRMLLYNMGGELSPYLRTLKECRFFRYDQGELASLGELIASKQYPADIEHAQRVVIEQAGITINMTEGNGGNNAPDHLQRLFAYNHIMQAMGADLLTRHHEDDALVQMAKEAYVVTPVSNLIVLETKNDYERFDIHDNQNSLKNASLKGKGAVPEPHEWALILVGLGCIVYMTWFKKKSVAAI